MCKKATIAGIICEYNPLHNGHRTLIEQTRRQGASHIIAVMSGNFVQRGETACLEKGVRARMALECGVDLVIELPLPWAAARAQTFAYGGVFLLDQLGCVDRLVFGSEHGGIHGFQTLAQLLLSEDFKTALLREISGTGSFARARQTAVAALCGPQTAALLEHPNNILGIEYCKALRQLGSPIQPQTIQRIGPGHHDATPGTGYASASFLRSRLAENPLNDLSAYMPQSSFDLLYSEAKAGRIASMARLETAILARLRTLDMQTLSQLPDISEGLERRLWYGIRQAATLSGLYQAIKSKRYPHARIRRMVLSAFLGLHADDSRTPPPYLRILGMNPKGMEILHRAKQTARLPILTKYSHVKSQNERVRQIFSLESRTTDLFTLSFSKPLECGLEERRKMIVTK